MAHPAGLEERLEYRFRDAALLQQALTHRSHGPANNERLEFLGDGVLGCAIAGELYRRFPDLSEGKLSRLRASLVREETLAGLAMELGLGSLMRLSDAEPSRSILADGLEALFGAVFLDGGYEAARQSILVTFGALLEGIDPERTAKDAKTQLQELLQARHRPLPEYRVLSVLGKAHRQSFEVECVVADLGVRAKGTGTSRQRAEQQAARAALQQLGE